MENTLKNLNNYKKVRDITLTKEDLIQFEEKIVSLWENGKIKAPIHFSHIGIDDYIFSTWRSHYHALLHGITSDWVENKILQGKSISLCNLDHNFYSSAIVTGVLPIALGTAIGLKKQNSKQKVWCFVGDDVIYYNYKSRYPHYGTGKWVIF